MSEPQEQNRHTKRIVGIYCVNQHVQSNIFVLLNYENNLLDCWDISLEESGSKALSLLGVFSGVGVGLKSSSGSAVEFVFTLLLFSLSTSSSSSIVH